jgi:hypothetical protein
MQALLNNRAVASAVVVILTLAGILIILRVIHKLYPHPIDSLRNLISFVLKETAIKSVVARINVLGIVIFGVLFFLSLIFHHALLLAENLKSTSGLSPGLKESTTLCILILIGFFLAIVISPVLIIQSEKEAKLKKRANKAITAEG